MFVLPWNRRLQTGHRASRYRPAVDVLEDRLTLSANLDLFQATGTASMWINGQRVIDSRLIPENSGNPVIEIQTTDASYEIFTDIPANLPPNPVLAASSPAPELMVLPAAPLAGIDINVRVADANGDGIPDVLLQDGFTGLNTVLIGVGSGQFLLPTPGGGEGGVVAYTPENQPAGPLTFAFDTSDPTAIRGYFATALDDFRRSHDPWEYSFLPLGPSLPDLNALAPVERSSPNVAPTESTSDRGRESEAAPLDSSAPFPLPPCDWRDQPTVRKLGCPYEGRGSTGELEARESPGLTELMDWLPDPGGEVVFESFRAGNSEQGSYLPPATLTTLSGKECGVAPTLFALPVTPHLQTVQPVDDGRKHAPPGVVIGLDHVPNDQTVRSPLTEQIHPDPADRTCSPPLTGCHWMQWLASPVTRQDSPSEDSPPPGCVPVEPQSRPREETPTSSNEPAPALIPSLREAIDLFFAGNR